MKDTMKPFRKAVFDCLNTFVLYKSTAVLVADAKVPTGQQPSLYILLGRQWEQDRTDQDCGWETKSGIEIQIIAKSGSEVSKDALDDISQSIYDLVLTLPGSNLLAVQNGFQILELRRESAAIGDVQISPTQSELQKIVSLTAYIFHQ